MNGVAPGTAPQRRRDVFVRRRIAVVATVAALILVGLLVTGGGSIANRPRQALSSTTTSSTHYRRQPKGLTPSAYLAPGSDPSVLPGPVLIADKSNNRLIEVSPTGNVLWEFPRPGDLAPGQTFRVPDDAFYTPDGKQIIATQEDDFAVTLIDVATHRIVWRYGTPGQSGAGPNQLWNPDDAIMLRDGRKHHSPNAGWPESAMAGALGLALAGPRNYPEGLVVDPWLGDGSAQAVPSDIARALHLYGLACLLEASLLLGTWLATHLTLPI